MARSSYYHEGAGETTLNLELMWLMPVSLNKDSGSSRIVATFSRNQWPFWNGITGLIRSEYAVIKRGKSGDRTQSLIRFKGLIYKAYKGGI